MPRWKNIKHEFDNLGNYFIKNSGILIIGKEVECKRVQKRLRFLDIDIDVRSDLPEYTFKTGMIGAINKILFRLKLRKYVEKLPKNYTLILAESKDKADNQNCKCVAKWLRKIGKKLGYKLYAEEEFFRHDLSIYAVYVKDLVYFRDTSFICTTVCNLNCKSCLNLNPYFKNKQHRNINELKKDIDSYFKCVDMVGRFHISGGEPQLYPDLSELILYIYDNYRTKIEAITVVTNGTFIPDDELCKVFKLCNVTVETDDYRASVPKLKATYPLLIQKLKSYNIKIDEIVAGEEWDWFEIFPPKNIIEENDVKKLQEKYEKCGNPFMGLAQQRLNNCCYAGFADNAGLVKQDDDEFFNLTNFTPNKKKELIEFRLRFNKKGYANFCRYCNGFPAINSSRVKPALQADGLIEWDINNPYATDTVKKDSSNA